MSKRPNPFHSNTLHSSYSIRNNPKEHRSFSSVVHSISNLATHIQNKNYSRLSEYLTMRSETKLQLFVLVGVATIATASAYSALSGKLYCISHSILLISLCVLLLFFRLFVFSLCWYFYFLFTLIFKTKSDLLGLHFID